MYECTKRFGPFSAAFRQPLAKSHCRFVHGYGLTFEVTFVAEILDENNWVIDFGSLKELKARLERMFDHRLIIAAADPFLAIFSALHSHEGCDLLIVKEVGIEAFAQYAHYEAVQEVKRQGRADRVNVVKVQCWEHSTNSASYSSGCTLF